MIGYKPILLTRGRVALVDDEDYELVSQFNWYASRSRDACGGSIYYAARMNDRKDGPALVLLHRFIMNAPAGTDVDHIDRTHTLDCRRRNLRLATRSQNIAHSRKRLNAMHSRYKGVTWCKGKWQVAIKGGGKNLYLGRYRSEEDAARLYNIAALHYFGEFALLNVVLGIP